MPTRALLIDDDPDDRHHLRKLLAAIPEVRIAGEADSLRSAKALARRVKYDLAIVDIRLALDTGFDVLPLLRRGTRVIFVSGHDRHALQAFDVNASDYLIKPVSRARLTEALRRVRQGTVQRDSVRADNTINLSSGRRAKYVAMSDLALIEAVQNYTRVHLMSGDRVLVRRSIRSWEDLIPMTQFVRVHRQALVNLRFVVRAEGSAKAGGWLHILAAPSPVRVGRRGWAELHDRMQAKFWIA